MSLKKMLITIGFTDYVIDPTDAIVLLTIAARAVPVHRPSWGDPYIQTGKDETFVTKAELVDYEPLALPASPAPLPAPVPYVAPTWPAGCRCPAMPGEACFLTAAECAATTANEEIPF